MAPMGASTKRAILPSSVRDAGSSPASPGKVFSQARFSVIASMFPLKLLRCLSQLATEQLHPKADTETSDVATGGTQAALAVGGG